MFFKLNNVCDNVIKRLIGACRVGLWLLPAGTPFVTIKPL